MDEDLMTQFLRSGVAFSPKEPLAIGALAVVLVVLTPIPGECEDPNS